MRPSRRIRVPRATGARGRAGLACFISGAIVWTAATANIAGAQIQTKVACLGEATTHSAHRTYDPEYPELMGSFLDPTFKVEASPANPLSGGMLFGAGTNFRIGNFGQPTGTSLINSGPETASTYGSPQMTMAEAFAPHVVVLGPYGPHEPYAAVSIPDHFAADLRTLAMRIMAFPSKPTVFISIPIARWGEDTDTLRRQIRDWTIQVAQELKLPTIDLWTAFLGKRAEFQDQNHLALAGRQRMGMVVGEAIRTWKANQGAAGTGGISGGTDAGAAGDAGVADGGVATGGTGGRVGGGGISGGNASGGRGGGTGGTDGIIGGTGGAVIGSGGAPGNNGGATGSGGAPSGSGGSVVVSTSGGAPGTAGMPSGGGGSTGTAGSTGVVTGADASTGPSGNPVTASGPIGCGCSAAPSTRGIGNGLLLAMAISALAFARGRRRRG